MACIVMSTVHASCSSVFLSSYRNRIFNQSVFAFLFVRDSVSQWLLDRVGGGGCVDPWPGSFACVLWQDT